MKEEELKNNLENLNPPTMTSNSYQHQFRSYLLNTKRSATIGVLLLILPFFFVISNVLEYILKINPGLFRKISDIFVYFDNHPGLWFLGPLILLGGPFLAVILNLLTILHIHYNKQSKEVIIALKVKWWNICIVFLCSLIVGILMLYLILENVVQ